MPIANGRQAGRIPATVITGFLGAGKTSLIRNVLSRANGRRIALIINEFGDLGIDGDVLRACGDEACSEEDIVELANGCICCTVADDFLPTMQALLERAEPPEHIVIETSGLALPKPLVRAFGWPEIRSRVTVDGVVTVIDGRAFADGVFAEDPEALAAQRAADPNLDHDSPLEELFDDQLACADLVVLNKSDLLQESELSAVREQIVQAARGGARLLTSAHGAVDPAVLLGLAVGAEDDLDARRSHHDDEDEHEHDDFESFVVPLPQAAGVEEVAARAAAALAHDGVLRVKGFAAVAGRDMRLVLQGVGGRLQHYFDRDWREGEARAGNLVVIGLSGLDRAAIERTVTGG
jgi:cobalamin biosynthesis protein CobW